MSALASQLDRLDHRQLHLLGLGGLLLLGAALVVYGVLPNVKAYRAATETRDVLRQANVAGGSIKEQLTELRQDIARLETQLHGDTANLPEKQLEAFVIGRLQSISWDNRVELVGVQPGQGEQIQTFNENLFEIELTGSYGGLFAWLRDVAAQLGFVVIKEYEMRPAEAVAENPRLHVELTLASYRASAS